MKNTNLLDIMGRIDPKLIADASPDVPQKKSSPKAWMKWASMAACFCLIISAIVIVPMLREDDPGVIPGPGTLDNPIVNPPDNSDRYKDFTIQSSEYGIVWPWEYKTIYEKYYSIDVGGTEFIGQQRELSASYVGEKLGSYKATGYDDTSDGVYHEHFDAYEIKDVASDRLIAVKMEDHYYVFISEKYNPPTTWGGVLEAYSLPQYVELGRFSVEEEGKDKTYHLLNDDEYIWSVLKDAKAAEAANPVGWHENRGNFVSFIVTSEALGVYKKVMYITESGYVWTNAFDGEYLYYIGEDAAGNIIKYAKENSTVAEFEPFNKTIAGKVTEITDDYILVDDSVLCKDPADGITYKIMIDDVKISRYVECEMVKVGSTIVVAYEGDIDAKNGNAISKAIDISEGIISDGDVLIPE